MEGGEVGGLGCVGTRRVPLPMQAIRLGSDCDVLDRMPSKQVLADLADAKGALNVRCPLVRIQTVCHRPALPAVFGDEGVQLWRYFRDGAPLS